MAYGVNKYDQEKYKNKETKREVIGRLLKDLDKVKYELTFFNYF